MNNEYRVQFLVNSCNCDECCGECLNAKIKVFHGEDQVLDDETGGYEDIESCIDGVVEIIKEEICKPI